MYRVRAAIIVACFLICTIAARAATTGVVRGVVTLNGKPQAGAALTLEGEGSRFHTTSAANGTYIFPSVPFGHYHVSVRGTNGMTRSVDLDVSSDTVATVDLPLEPLHEIANTTVTAHAGVGGNPVAVNTLSRSQIAVSPERDSLNRLIETLPGIVRFSYNEPIAHGFHGISYEIDGAPLPLATSSNFGEIIDPKSIDSLEVFTGAFPAEYGGSRMGALVNIVSTRLSDRQPGAYGNVSIGGGTDATSLASIDELIRFPKSELYLSLNGQRTNRGLDTPAYDAINDTSSQADAFARYLTQMGARSTLAVDVSNQLNQFQIPINTDPQNPVDPIVSVPGTNDVQREYDRFLNVNFTTTSKDGNGIFQFIPWVRSTRIAYDGDLVRDVLANQVGLRQDRHANYVGARTSLFRAGEHHAWKVGIDALRENFSATQTFACYTADCNPAPSTPPPPPPAPGYYATSSAQTQAGTLLGLYAQDKWQPSGNVAVNYGLRYDHSTGYVGGSMLEPRIGVNISDGAKNVFHVYYGRMYAAPQLEDVRADCVLLSGCPTTPVYDLQPERDAYVEMGVAHAFNNHLKGYANIFQRSAVNVLDTTQFLNTPLFAVYNNATGSDSGVEFRLEDSVHGGDSWFVSGTVSGAYAGGISGSTFLFPTDALDTGGLPITSHALWAPEDHDQSVAGTASYTHVFGTAKSWYATLQADYGSGYPVNFQNVASGTDLTGRLPAHTILAFSLGKHPTTRAIGFDLDVYNALDHRYVIKIANGFNTTQIAQGRQVLLRLTAPF